MLQTREDEKVDQGGLDKMEKTLHHSDGTEWLHGIRHYATQHNSTETS
jgi:hypothetical protein